MIAGAFLIAGCAACFGVVAGILLHKIIGWYIEGTIGGMQCIIVAGLYVGLVISIVTLNIFVAALLLAALVLLLLISKRQEQKITRDLQDDQITQYRTVIAGDPQNLAARSRLAEVLREKGMLDEAITEMTEVVRLSPESRREAYRLNMFIEEREEQKAPPITCPSCGHRNPPDRTRCANCEGDLRLLSELKKWLAQGGLRQIAVTWAIAIALITVMMFALSALPLQVRLVLTGLFLLAVILLYLVRAYRNF